MTQKYGQRSQEAPKTFLANLVTPNFIVYIITLFVGIGISIGTYQINISTTRMEQERLARELKEMQNEYLRIDIYEIRHRVLENQLMEIGTQIREIREAVIKKK